MCIQNIIKDPQKCIAITIDAAWYDVDVNDSCYC